MSSLRYPGVMVSLDNSLFSIESPPIEAKFLGPMQELVETRMVQVHNHVQHALVTEIICDVYRVIPKDWKVYVLGSLAIGLAGPNTQVDLFIDQGNYYPKILNKKEKDILQASIFYMFLTNNGIEGNLFTFKNVMCCKPRIPLLQWVHVHSGRNIDISTANGLGVENSNLLRAYLNSDPRVKWVVVVVHEWCKVIGVLGESPLFRPYGLTWLILFTLMQTFPPVVPPLTTLQAGLPPKMIGGWDCRFQEQFPKTENKQNRIQLLIKFLEFMASFNYKYDVVCPLTGNLISKKNFNKPKELPCCMNLYKEMVPKKPYMALKRGTAICLQDPIELFHNITHKVEENNVKKLIKLCSDSNAVHRLLLQPIVDEKHEDFCSSHK